jgi:hypothetical protein
VDFCVIKGIPQDFATVKSCFDLSSDHSPALITLTTHVKNREKQPCLSNIYTNCDDFRHLVNKKRTLKVPLNTEENIEAAVKFFNDTIQWADFNTTPEHTDILTTLDCPIQIKQKQNRRKTKTPQSLAPIPNTRKQDTTQPSKTGT